RKLRFTAAAMMLSAIVVGLLATGLNGEAQAGAFVGSGAMVLMAGLTWIWLRLRGGSTATLATASNLGFLTEPMVNGTQRPRLGNGIYGQYGQDYTSSDGATFMLVALTNRHFRDLTELTGTTKAVAAVAEALGADFADEGQRYEHRAVLTGLFSPWFRSHTADEVSAALSASSVLWDRYLDFVEVAQDPRVTANPLFSALDQPRIGTYLAPGLPMSVDGAHVAAQPAPALGDDTAAVLAELGLTDGEIADLVESGTVTTGTGLA
ncbi:MAG: CoA transferase, partial [Mycolicibacterium aromaticivorans]|nr:CoA transferase [Mycolicibacterium aromaticivorans]